MVRLIAMALSAGLSATSAGLPLIDNLSEPVVPVPTLVFRAPTDALWAAQSFVANAERYTLDSIETNLGSLVGSPTVIAELRLGPTPSGAVLATFAITIPATAPVLLTLVPSSAVVLEPGGSYVLVLGVADEGSFEWPYAETTVWTGPGAFSSYFYTSDDGVTWINFGGERPYLMRVNATPVPCYANCDGSAAAPVLNALDFACFLTSFRAGELYANCDGSTTEPVLNALDFACFLARYRAGCP